MDTDLRNWFKEVENRGELKTINGAHWNLEVGGITQLNWKKRPNPALLFDNIKDYPPGFRVLTSSTSTFQRIALTYGIPVSDDEQEVVDSFSRSFPGWIADIGKYPPVQVKDGPVMENSFQGKDIDLFKFPTPMWHEDDGGRFIGTGCAVITRSPDSNEINLGTYRIMLHDHRTMGFFSVPGRHGRIHCENYHQKGEKCPIAVSFGHHPLYFRAAAADLPLGAEYNFIGAVAGSPVEVITEEITGLPVPANSEIVIAGWCPPGKLLPEGPFGEYTGYYGGQHPAPVIEVERIYHRNGPVILGSPPGRAPNDSSYFMSLMCSMVIKNYLITAGIPDIKAVWLCEVGGPQLIVISLKQRYAGHAKQAALIASQSPTGTNMGRYVIVVDEDINPRNIDEVLWALAFRSDPEQGIDIIRRARSNSLDPMVQRPITVFHNNVGIIEACKPFERLETFPKEVTLSPALEAKIKHFLS
ncbi:MAG: UbiD family decarboxylase [Dehalococcoidia bacterium]|nr:UbiD family decarboxylase [Dehalococcoidia bacterium]